MCVYSCIIYISYHVLLIIFPSKNTSNGNNKLCNISNNIWQTYFLQIIQSFYPKFEKNSSNSLFDDIKDYLPLLFFFNKYKQINSLFDDLKDYLSWWLLFITKSQYQLKDYLLWWLFFIIRPSYQLVVSSS